MSQHSRVVRTLGVAFAGTALAIALAACSAGTATKPTATPKPAETGIAAGGTPTATPSGNPVGAGDVTTASGFTAVFDDSHHVGVAVPDAWTDVNGAGFVDGDGNDWISVTAAPNIDDFQNNWGAAGVQVAASPFATQVTAEQADADVLARLASVTGIYNYDAQCTNTKSAEAYSDQVYTGYFSTWQNCGGTATSVLLLTAYDNGGTHEVFVNAALVSDDDKNATLDSIINSFQASFDDRAIAPRG